MQLAVNGTRLWFDVEGPPGGIADINVVEGAGHFTWLDAPERCWPALIDFVERR